MPLLVIVGHFAAYKPSHDPLSIAITVLAQAAVTWPLHVIPGFLIAKGFKLYGALSSDTGVTKIALYWASGLIVYGVGYVYWHRFWYRSIFAVVGGA